MLRLRRFKLRSLAPLSCLVLIFSGISRPVAAENFVSYPAHPDFPTTIGKSFFNWQPGEDQYTEGQLLNLRYLNEAVAGEQGWVTQEGGRFLLGDGRPVRFWSTNITGNAPTAMLEDLARHLAKLGVNMVRVHGPRKSLLTNSSTTLQDVDMTVVDQMQRAIAAMKKEGIYTFVSNLWFIVDTSIKASWELDGFTAEWIAANPNSLSTAALIYLDDKLRAAYLNAVEVLVTTPNPYLPDRTPIARDTSVAIIECVNEDNLFFNTFRPARWPAVQSERLYRRFFQWVADRYRDPENPLESDLEIVQRVRSEIWGPRANPAVEKPEDGMLTVVDAATMAVIRSTQQVRFADQLEFLADIQRSLFQEVVDILRREGYGGTVSGSNWKTTNDKVLLDLEFHTYTTAGVIDTHNYFSPAVANSSGIGGNILSGDEYLAIPAVVNPRRGPVGAKQVEGYPFTCSESTWVNVNLANAEGPLTVAAYGSMMDLDCFVWFAQGTEKWATSMRRWAAATPTLLGQFPATALLYRRGDVAEAPVVVREGRTLEGSLYPRETAIFMTNRGFDPTRDDPSTYDGVPHTGLGAVDPLAALVGKVKLTFDTDQDYVSPVISTLIDNEAGTVTSATGQVRTDATRGLLTVDSPRAQGATGFMRHNSPIELSDTRIEMTNGFGALTVISLDDLPLSQSSRILIQAATITRPTGFTVNIIPMTWNDNTYAGHRIVSMGGSPWQVERIQASVTLRDLGPRFLSAQALDENGYAKRALQPTAGTGVDLVLPLAADALYTIVELTPLAALTPIVSDRGLPLGHLGQQFSHQLSAMAVSEPPVWSLAESSPSLPAGLSLEADGTLVGTPSEGGHFELVVRAESGGVPSAPQRIPLTILPIPPAPEPLPPLWGTPSPTENKVTSLGLIYDGGYPFIWHWTINRWMWVEPHSTSDSTFLWVFDGPGFWTWTREEYADWYWSFDPGSPGWKRWGES